MGTPNEPEINEEAEDFVDELKPGTELMHGQYRIESFLNAGGFGITYLARDSLDRKIVIKECFPGAFCRRSRTIVQARSRAHQPELQSIVRLFVQEAKSLAKLNHPNIVGVHQVFEDNDTAYMALDFVEGRDMLDTLDDPDVVMTPEQIKQMLIDILGAVQFIHDQDILHRDISPDNILIDGEGRPVLIDFGAAREQATKQSRVLSALRVVKDGYSPQEFYIAGSDQDESSDLYALGASFYHFITGDCPPNSQARLAAIASEQPDPYVPLAGTLEGYDDNFLAALDKSLEVLPKDRVQSAQAWLNMMDGRTGEAAPAAAPVMESDAIAEAVAATAPANESKSKVGLLLASAAVIAAVGVGAAMTLSGGDDTTSAQTAAAEAEAEAAAAAAAAEIAAAEAAAEAEVAAAEREARAQAEAEAEELRQALAAAEAAAEEERAARAEELARLEAENAERSQALAEAQAAAEAERAERAAELARLEEENERRRTEQAEARELAEAQAAAEAKAAADAIAAAEAQAQAAEEARQLAQALAAEEEARREAEAKAEQAQREAQLAAERAAEAQAKAEAAALAAATLDTPTPPIETHSMTLLANLAGGPQLPLAAFNSNLPADPTLSDLLSASQIAPIATGAVVPSTEVTPGVPSVSFGDDGLPVLVANVPNGNDGFSGFGLPDAENGFLMGSFQLAAGIPGFVPGTELPSPEPEVASITSVEDTMILSAWSVELPFEGRSSSSRVIGSVGPVAPVWVNTGVEIDTVNGLEIESIEDIGEILRGNVELTDEERLELSFGVIEDGNPAERNWSVPIVQRTALLNGIGFETRLIDGEWETRVTSAPESVSSDLQVGDKIIAYMRTSEKVNERTSMLEILEREMAEGESQFSFAVDREGSMWIASLEYARSTE